MANDAAFRRTIQWPDDKLVCCTFSVALEAFRKTGRFKMDSRHRRELPAPSSHAEYGGQRRDLAHPGDPRAAKGPNHGSRELPGGGEGPGRGARASPSRHEIAGHGTTNEISMIELSPEEQKEEIDSCTRILEDITGTRPVGWSAGRPSHRRHAGAPGRSRLPVVRGSVRRRHSPCRVGQRPAHLRHPQDLVRQRLARPGATAWGNASTFFTGFKDGFDFVYEEARQGRPGMIDACVHAELGGRPYLAAGFERIIEYVNRRRGEIWQPTYREIAEYCLGR